MKQYWKEHALPRWWIGAFIVFFLLLFSLNSEEAQPNTYNETARPSIGASDEEDIRNYAEFKRIESAEELNQLLASAENAKPETSQETTITQQTNEEKKKEQEEALNRKWDVKKGFILSETFTLDQLTKGIHTYQSEEDENATLTPVLHETSATTYYEYPMNKKMIIQATAVAESQLIRTITVLVLEQKAQQEVFDLFLPMVSPELTENKRMELTHNMMEGTIHKVQTEKGIVYQWTKTENGGVLTILKEKE